MMMADTPASALSDILAGAGIPASDIATYVGIALAVLGAIGGVFKFFLSVTASNNPDLIVQLRAQLAEQAERIQSLEEDVDQERRSREDDRRTYQLQIADLQREVRDLMRGRA